MPNWCENELEVRGKPEEITELLKAIKTEESNFDFNTVIPYPKEYADPDRLVRAWEKEHGKHCPYKDGYNQGGYEWCIANWGTKWNACDIGIDFIDGYAKIEFRTAWSPPVQIVEKLAQMFPTLELTLAFFECGAGFKGLFKVKSFTIIDEFTTDYNGNRGG